MADGFGTFCRYHIRDRGESLPIDKVEKGNRRSQSVIARRLTRCERSRPLGGVRRCQ